ncbi:MAG: hypothetical protein IJW16_06210 [Clostridia bacterium]|nr:hypothetical protein [Clostridia bacterium]
MWYQNSFRRHLCDMHIDDWDDSFLSRFDPESYVENLKRARVQSAMLYFQSHVGLCYYPTESGKMHRAFVGCEDKMRRLVDLCHENGITVTGYYSLIYNTYEHDRHPSWRMLDAEGYSHRERVGACADMEFSSSKKPPRYGFCCPNNHEYRAFVKEQIKEMAAYFPTVEGMFYDMLFWPHPCYCDACKKRWRDEVGGELPVAIDWQDGRWLLHMQKRREWMGEFAHWVTDLTKAMLPSVSVEHNVAYSALPNGTVANCEEVISACDYAGGDLYRGISSQSFACKFYRAITKNQPFEYMFSRCAPKLSAHTQIKVSDVLRATVGLTTAHHGASLAIDAIDPVGTMDARVYTHLGEIFGELEALEPYLSGKPIADVGLYYSLKSKFDPFAEGYTNYLGVTNTVENLIGAHLLSDVTGGFAPLDRFPAIVASCLTEEDAYDYERLQNYVRTGGTLYISGGACKGLLEAFFGAKCTGRTAESVVYLSPKESVADAFGHFNESYPLCFDGTAPIVEGIDPALVLATVTLPYTLQDTKEFASIHSNPPAHKTDIPALAATAYGLGRVIWSALPIECCALYDYRRILLSLLRPAVNPTISTDADEDIEITAYDCDASLRLHTVLLNTREFARRVVPFSLTVRTKKSPARILSLPDKRELPFIETADGVCFTVDQNAILRTFDIQY